MPIFPFNDGELPNISLLSGGNPLQNLPINTKGMRDDRQSRLEVKNVGDNIPTRSLTPPVRISSQSPARLNGSVHINNELVGESKLDFEELRRRATKKKDKTMQPGAPAMHTVRGFQTPVTSGDEESALSAASTPKLRPKDLASITNSPSLRPATPSPGISALKLQLDTLNIGSRSPRLGGL